MSKLCSQVQVYSPTAYDTDTRARKDKISEYECTVRLGKSWKATSYIIHRAVK
jgi:hypothetical protein